MRNKDLVEALRAPNEMYSISYNEFEETKYEYDTFHSYTGTVEDFIKYLQRFDPQDNIKVGRTKIYK